MLLTKRLCGDLVYYRRLKKKIQIITEARTVKNGKPLLKLKLAIMLIDYNDKVPTHNYKNLLYSLSLEEGRDEENRQKI